MMRLYQPLCPDITLRLAADLSPDDSEDSTASSPSSSSSSSASSSASVVEEEEEAKRRATYDAADGGNQNRSSSSSSSSSSSASVVAGGGGGGGGGASPQVSSKNAKEIYNQGHASTHHAAPPAAASTTSSSLSTTALSPGSRQNQQHPHHHNNHHQQQLQQPRSEEGEREVDTVGGPPWNGELNSNHTFTETEAITSTKSTSGLGSPQTLSYSTQPSTQQQHHHHHHDTATVTHGVKRRADDSAILSSSSSHPLPPPPPQPTTTTTTIITATKTNSPPYIQEQQAVFQPSDCVENGRRCSGDDDDGDDDDNNDNDSIEDISISHNVPMCLPTSTTPSPVVVPTPASSCSPSTPRGRVGAAEEEERGGASGGSSSSVHCAGNKTSGLHLDVRKRAAKYQGPYTLACDVTPSPMQEHVTLANTVAGAGNSVSGHVTAGKIHTTTTTTTTSLSSSGNININNSSGVSIDQLKGQRRPRKLPEIPRKHQGLASASSSHARSIFDEIQEALIKEATSDGGDEVFLVAPSSSSSCPAASSEQDGCTLHPSVVQQYPYIHKHVGHLFDKKRLLIGYASSSAGPSTFTSHRSRNSSLSSQMSVSGRSRNVSTSSVASEVGAAASSSATIEGEGMVMGVMGEAEATDPYSSVVTFRATGAPHPHPHPHPHLQPSPSPSSTAACLPPSSSSAFSPSPSPSSSSSLPFFSSCSSTATAANATGIVAAGLVPSHRRKTSEGDGSRRRHNSSSSLCGPYQDMEVTHRGLHRFIPRHADEVQIGIGDPIHVIREYDDLWCEGVNLRSGERGIFPAMYANDLTFLEDSDGDEEHWKFTMRFLGAVEVTSSSGDFALCQAITKVAQQGRVKSSSFCTLEINQYGIRMIDKSKDGHEKQKFSNFFALKNISFCGTHPNNNRYFAFITKHPRELRFACHVFHSDRSTNRARDALGNAFKRFYQEYMAFTHPTEDIWME